MCSTPLGLPFSIIISRFHELYPRLCNGAQVLKRLTIPKSLRSSGLSLHGRAYESRTKSMTPNGVKPLITMGTPGSYRGYGKKKQRINPRPRRWSISLSSPNAVHDSNRDLRFFNFQRSVILYHRCTSQ
jgi:hypothetical protein